VSRSQLDENFNKFESQIDEIICLLEKANSTGPLTASETKGAMTDWETYSWGNKVRQTFDPFLDHTHKGNQATIW